jgi:peptide/nickel transport system substrate-binding protein
MRPITAVASLALAALLAVALAACGSSATSSTGNTEGASGTVSTGGFQSPTTESLTAGKRGGTLVVLNESDFESLDPGNTYYDIDYEVVLATQRPLYSHKPNSVEPSPDIASGPAEISADNKTVTVHLKEGIHFSPPVDREATAEDVAYAIERGANPNVANPYFSSYFASIEGAPNAEGGPIKGIQTPNRHTIVFHLSEPKGQFVADALVLPLSAPVPKEYAQRFDENKPSSYANYQVATGPYMLKNDAEGKVLGIGYVPGKSATLVRNPNWNPSTDFRPAYLNEIQIKLGGSDAVIGRQVLEGTDVVENEAPAQSIVQLAAEHYKSQLEISPGASSHYIAVNNKVGPFSNVDVRKALWASLDRAALDKARGGELVTNVATHFIYPTIPGFDQAGGVAGPKVDYNEHPEGDAAVAEKYLKLAGYPSGRYTSGKPIEVVGSRGNPSEQDAEIVNESLKALGFTTRFTLVEPQVMYAKYCGVPKEEIDVCPSVAWAADFADAQAVLGPTFNGKAIEASANNNWGQVNDPAINAAIAAAEPILGTGARATAWAKIDDELVADAAAIPFDWDKQPNIEGKDVVGVGDLWDAGEWDYNYTSLK